LFWAHTLSFCSLAFKHSFTPVMRRKPTVCTLLSLLQHYEVVLYHS